MESPEKDRRLQDRTALAVCGFLLLAVLLVFGRTLAHDFVGYDDPDYVTRNPHVLRGVTANGIAWALTARHASNWHPMTWFSHMLDCQLHGLRAGGHHLTSVLLHAAVAIGLFLVFHRMTGDLWPSAFVAAVFAIHPLRAESVAWVAERKDVLSGLFFVLTLAAYVRFVRSPFSFGRYLAVIALFALGLMAKPMLVTLPFVLLLLDYWPLRRAATDGGGKPSWGRLVVEKVPLFALSAISCVVTTWAQKGAIAPLDALPFSSRIANALVVCVAYIGKMFWPADLAALYPYHAEALSWWRVLGAAAALLAISQAAVMLRRRSPYFLVGWLWYLGMLVPVIGLVQVGGQTMADRYTYLPQIGLCVAIAWGAADAFRSWPRRSVVYGVVAGTAIAALMGCAWRQAGVWRDSETLWTHALACTSNNVAAHNNLAEALLQRRRIDRAVAEYRKALDIKPDDVQSHHNLANLLAIQGKPREAEEHFRAALATKRNCAEAHVGLANLLAKEGRIQEALEHYDTALKIKPNSAEAHNNLANRLVRLGRFDEAEKHYRTTLKLLPRCYQAEAGLGNALARQGQLEEAVECYHRALAVNGDYPVARNGLRSATAELARFADEVEQCRDEWKAKPNNAAAANNLAWLLATCPVASLRDGKEALEIARQADRLSGGDRPAVLDTVAAAQAEAGQCVEAAATARRAVELAERQNKVELANGLRIRLALYESGKPFRQVPRLSGN